MENKNYLFTSESVSSGHPDKIADQISDRILDAYLEVDSDAHVACEVMCTTDYVLVSGEITSKKDVDIEWLVRDTIKSIGYDKTELGFCADTCKIDVRVHKQSPDIARGVDKDNESEQGAGDQGIMFGYACNENNEYIPTTLYLSHKLLSVLEYIRKNTSMMPYLRPDAKSQFTVEYDGDGNPAKVKSIVLSTQHSEFMDDDKQMLDRISFDVEKIVIPRLLDKLEPKMRKLFYYGYKLMVNPTGKFVIGGPTGDTGLTGRKIIVDTYGGACPHGGGAFSGKDPSKVDRSAAYMARYIAKNMVIAGVAPKISIQVGYAIGIAEPVSVYVNTYGKSNVSLSDAELAQRIMEIFDLRPSAIIKKLGLKNPIYFPTATYGHFGKNLYSKTIDVFSDNKRKERKVWFFPWERVDVADEIRRTITNKFLKNDQ